MHYSSKQRSSHATVTCPSAWAQAPLFSAVVRTPNAYESARMRVVITRCPSWRRPSCRRQPWHRPSSHRPWRPRPWRPWRPWLPAHQEKANAIKLTVYHDHAYSRDEHINACTSAVGMLPGQRSRNAETKQQHCGAQNAYAHMPPRCRRHNTHTIPVYASHIPQHSGTLRHDRLRARGAGAAARSCNSESRTHSAHTRVQWRTLPDPAFTVSIA